MPQLIAHFGLAHRFFWRRKLLGKLVFLGPGFQASQVEVAGDREEIGPQSDWLDAVPRRPKPQECFRNDVLGNTALTAQKQSESVYSVGMSLPDLVESRRFGMLPHTDNTAPRLKSYKRSSKKASAR